MNALVTGGAGFIGSHLVDALLGEGHAVTVVDDLSRGKREQVDRSATFFRCRVEDRSFVDIACDGSFDVLFHLAAQIDVRVSMRDPLADARANVLGTVNVLQASRSAGIPRVVFASSGGTVYGDTDTLPTPESHQLEPESAYGAAKVSGELYGEMFDRIAGLRFVALRYANVYGPRQDPYGEAGVVAIFASRLLAGETSVINGDGLQTRDYVYVDDVVQANLAAAASDARGPINVGTQEATDVNSLFAKLAGACGNGAAAATHGPPKDGEQRRSVLAIDRAARDLGWQPRVDIDSGLRRTVDHFRHS